jgi:hypothetical protein
MGTRKRMVIGFAIAIVALLVAATAAIAAGPGMLGMRGNKAVPGGNGGANFGPRAVVTAVNATNQTITLGGLPQQVATVKVDANVKLVAIQADGTTTPATFDKFTVGSLVDVQFKGNGRGRPGNQQAPANGQATPNFTVTQLALVPAGQVRVEGLVVSTASGIQIVDGGGLQLTVTTSGTTKVTKGNNTAAAVTDIKVGDRIGVSGTQNGVTIAANTIRIADLSARPRAGAKPGAASPTAKP